MTLQKMVMALDKMVMELHKDDEPHEMVYYIKSKGAGRTLRKLEDEKQRIIITVKGTNGATVNYLGGIFYGYKHKPDEVFLNNNKDNNYNSKNSISLNQEGENKIEVVWNNKLTTLEEMFKECKSIVSLDLSKLITLNVTSMRSMFNGCSSLVSLDLSSFITSNVNDMANMFRGCSSLESLDLSNFITSNVNDMSNMFHSCYSLESLDLSNFITSKVQRMEYMFGFCSSLVSLDISNFNTSNAYSTGGVLYDCSSLRYINLLNYIGQDIFTNFPKNNNLSICINDFEQIDNGDNCLKNNNVTIFCKKDSDKTNDKTPEKRKRTNDWKTVKILKEFKALKRYRIIKRLKILKH